MGLPYPGGPLIDKYAQTGNPQAFNFSKPKIEGLNYSFSGLKTSFLYFLRDRLKEDNQFINKNIHDLSASLQYTINNILIDKLMLAIKNTNIRQIAISGGVSANSGLRSQLSEKAEKFGFETFFPKFSYSTDNAAMIAVTGYFKFLKGDFSNQNVTPYPRNMIL